MGREGEEGNRGVSACGRGRRVQRHRASNEIDAPQEITVTLKKYEADEGDRQRTHAASGSRNQGFGGAPQVR